MTRRKNFTGKPRIAMLGHKRVPGREGGVEVVVEELSTRMAALGYDVTLYNRSGHRVSGTGFDAGEVSEYKGVHVKSVPTIAYSGLAAVSSSFFASIFAALGPYDIVHYHAEGPCAFLWIPKLFGKKCIATVHGIDWRREKWKKSVGALFIHLGERTAVKYADEIIVLSRSMQEYFKDTYHRETHYIPNGVDRPIAREADSITNAYDLEKDSYILFLGRLVAEKGLRYLIEAYKSLKTSKKLVIAGEIADRRSFADELHWATNGNEKILFTGFVQERLLSELYSNAYVYVLPSDLEGMPLSLLEAMSYGNCCITSDIAECAEVVEDKAVTFRRSSVKDLREKMQMLCDHPELVQKYRREAADFICRKCNWDEVTERTVSLYRG